MQAAFAASHPVGGQDVVPHLSGVHRRPAMCASRLLQQVNRSSVPPLKATTLPALCVLLTAIEILCSVRRMFETHARHGAVNCLHVHAAHVSGRLSLLCHLCRHCCWTSKQNSCWCACTCSARQGQNVAEWSVVLLLSLTCLLAACIMSELSMWCCGGVVWSTGAMCCCCGGGGGGFTVVVCCVGLPVGGCHQGVDAGSCWQLCTVSPC